MVNIVVISHSSKLAEGVRELAEQVAQGKVAIAVAGGIDDPDNPIGTDAVKVLKAIESVYSPDGVLVLMDMGSALLSAEVARDLLAPNQKANVHLCSAPLIEGTIAAAVQASTGASMAQVLAEAQNSLSAKIAHLAQDGFQDACTVTSDGETSSGGLQIHLQIQNPQGIHARPAANIVKTSSRFAADITIRAGRKSASAKSINQIATLGVRQGQEVVVSAVGKDAAEALSALEDLANDNFGESCTSVIKPPDSPHEMPAGVEELTGIPASPGIALGPAFLYQPRMSEVKEHTITDIDAEWTRLQAAIADANKELEDLQKEAGRRIGQNEGAILEVHEMILQDPALHDLAKDLVFNHKRNAEFAWQSAIEEIVGQYRELDDDYLRARAADVLDVGQRVLRRLLDVIRPSLETSRPVIVVAHDITPSDIAGLNPASVLGICTEEGAATSHAIILARSMCIPVIVCIAGIMDRIKDQQFIALDGSTGRLWLNPSPERLTQLRECQEQWCREQEECRAAGQQPAVTRDGHCVSVAANIGTPLDTRPALEYGAEGVGLFRTEFLFFDRNSSPDEEEQLSAYLKVVQAMGDRPVTIRTLDAGGDKPLPYLAMAAEDNPVLGLRGIRLCLSNPDLFKTQLRAILRASYGHNLKLMFPMVSTLAELRTARGLLAEVQSELHAGGVKFDERLPVGIMIEVPSAVAIADHLAAEVEFFSIGTNDLTQYVMAADRGNVKVADLANALQPAVLRLIHQTVIAAHSAGKQVSMCGELAGNPLASSLLIGLGLDELSMNAASIPAVKAAIRKVSLFEAKEVAKKVLAQNTLEDIHHILNDL
jgi:phosphoenolpyruvate-protein phosphotransferase/dihydroxyacetone kinase phosphotransfer subunit